MISLRHVSEYIHNSKEQMESNIQVSRKEYEAGTVISMHTGSLPAKAPEH